jgi:hypothetical protein
MAAVEAVDGAVSAQHRLLHEVFRVAGIAGEAARDAQEDRQLR